MTDPWRDIPTLTGRYVKLRPLVLEDADTLLTATEPLRDLFYTIVPTPETIEATFASLREEQAAGRALPFAVLDRSGRLVGTTRFMRMTEANRRVEIGGTLYHPSVQRTGLNTEAKRLLLGYAFETLDCQCVQIRTDFLNRRSRTAIERLGAKLDGIIRGHRIMPDGRVRDMAVYSIIAGEWPGVRSNLDLMLKRHGEPKAEGEA